MKILALLCRAPLPPFLPDGYWPGSGPAPYSTRTVGLWTFICVVCTLFGLFGAAYLMRIGYEDWRVLPPVPWQLWLSTGLLAAGDGLWPPAARAAGRRRAAFAARLGVAAWCLSAAFIGAQLWAWEAMAAQRVVVTSGPAAGFFYMLTGLHIAHVAGGMLAAGWVLSRPWAEGRSRLAEALALCARYWHALLLLWLAVFGLLFGMTPGVVRELCAAVGIPLR